MPPTDFKGALTGALSGAVRTMQNLFGARGKTPAPDGSETPVYDQDLIDHVEKEFKRRQTERQLFELQWRLNMAFYEGNQYVDINTASLALEEQPLMYDWQEREVFNRIAPNIEVRISKLKRVRSILKCRPGTDDRSDLHSSKVATMILKNNYANLNIRDRQAEELGWMELCGTVFRKHIWDPNAGPVIGRAEPEIDPAIGQPTSEGQEVHEGDQKIYVTPPHEFLPDSCYRSSLDDCKSAIHAKAFEVEDIKEVWGVGVSPEKVEVEKLQRSSNGLSGLGYGQGGYFAQTIKLEHHAVVKEYMERPSKTYPEGRLIIVAGGKLLYAGVLPYIVGENGERGFPFSMLKCLDRPGIFWGKTVLERMIPVQRRYNALRNRKAEYLNRAAIGQWAVQEGSVDVEIFQTEAGSPGAIHEYQKGFSKPEMIATPSLPADFDSEMAALLAEFNTLSGVGEISRESSTPAGVKSGVAISLLQEQDDTRISNTAENIERFNIQSGKIQLRLSKQFVKAPRVLSLVGKNNVAEVIDWVGSDIRSEDIVLDNSSALAESISQKRQMIFDLLGTNLLTDPDTGRIDKQMRSKVLEMIEMGEWESADDEEQLHIAKAERENRAMIQGAPEQAVYYDDPILHVAWHNKFRLTTDYEELKAQNPLIEQIFDAHIQMHLMQVQQQARVAMGAAQPGQFGSAPGGGGENAA